MHLFYINLELRRNRPPVELEAIAGTTEPLEGPAHVLQLTLLNTGVLMAVHADQSSRE